MLNVLQVFIKSHQSLLFSVKKISSESKAQELKEQAEEAGLSVDEIQLTIDGYEIE